tara:strand:- start:308 stop:481 length:174 start_codon:yes stop_codon:yes gene_type:complete
MRVTIKVHREVTPWGGGVFVARANNGWWVGRGKTAKEAQKRVIQQLEKEVAWHENKK